MNKHKRIGLGVLIAVVLLLVLTIPTLAKRDATFLITYEFTNVDWANFTADGTFTLQTQTDTRSGDATLSWSRRSSVRTGTMTFTNVGPEAEAGSFTFRFALPDSLAGDICGTGSFTATDSSGVYEDYWGRGTITMCRVDETTLDGTLDGWVRYK